MKMSNTDFFKKFEKMILDYRRAVRSELHDRWTKWTLELSNREMYEVIGALLARQVTLATQLASAPSVWNGHVASLFLRTMTDVYISLAWIFVDPLERSKKFILHGLGQLKLEIEHRKEQLKKDGKDINSDPLIKFREDLLNSQRYSFLTEVNIGSWSGIDTRTMAEEAGCLDFYRYSYTLFSASIHSMWHHIERYNLEMCPNPLHGYHRLPIDPDIDMDPDYLYRAAKYVEKTFKLFDEKTGIKTAVPSAFKLLVKNFEEFSKTGNIDENLEETNCE